MVSGEYLELRRETRRKIFRGPEGSETDPRRRLAPYYLLAILRLVLALAPQSGYIHPDEYFQSLEIVTGDIFGTSVVRAWEFNASAPVRSVVLPYTVVGIPLTILKLSAPFASAFFGLNVLTPYFILVLPRLTLCLLSFITDYSLYKICEMYGQNYRSRLVTLASSYVSLVYASRTLSNTTEMILTSLLIYLVAQSMITTDRVKCEETKLLEKMCRSDCLRERVKLERLRLSLPWHSLHNVFWISSITVIGVFNRPTFLLFAFPPIFFWILRGMKWRESSSMSEFNSRVFGLAGCSLPLMCVHVLVDSAYYGYLTWHELLHQKLSIATNFVVTPYNFIRYNMVRDNLASHGLHPRVTHLLVNIPLLYNVLGIAALAATARISYALVSRRWGGLARVESILGLMTWSLVVPVTGLSWFEHQEARFLLPITLPLVFLHAQRLRHVEPTRGRATPPLLLTWYTINILLTVIFGFVHQAGIYPLSLRLSQELSAKPRLTALKLVTSHLYPLPTSLLLLRYGKPTTQVLTGSRYAQGRDFFTEEVGSTLSAEELVARLVELREECTLQWRTKRLKSRLYLAAPSSLRHDLLAHALAANLTLQLDTVFYPHLSIEAPPSLSSSPPSTSPLHLLSHLSHQLGLCLFRVPLSLLTP